MKYLLGSKSLFLAALFLVLFVNGFILIGVWYNHSGEAESTVVLTEREVHMPYRWHRDETSVRIDWRIVSAEGGRYSRYSSPIWFDQQKLMTLGFEFSDDFAIDKNTHFIEAEAILVLEYDGDAYQQTVNMAKNRLESIEKKLSQLTDDEDLLADLKDATENLQHEERSASRLFVIDVGLDKQTLRALYPDKQRYILAYGIVDVRAYGSYSKSENQGLLGRIDRLSIEYLHVDNDIHAQIDKLKSSSNTSRNGHLPRFSLEVHYGQKLEPWIQKFYLLNFK
jgi:hypothetical protein